MVQSSAPPLFFSKLVHVILAHVVHIFSFTATFDGLGFCLFYLISQDYF